MIRKGDYQMGDRLPPIMEMARRFGVGHPTIREALKKLETMGIVEIRHGSGVYVSRSEEVLVLASPDYAGTLTKKLLVDLISARISLEVQSAVDAVQQILEDEDFAGRNPVALAGFFRLLGGPRAEGRHRRQHGKPVAPSLHRTTG